MSVWATMGVCYVAFLAGGVVGMGALILVQRGRGDGQRASALARWIARENDDNADAVGASMLATNRATRPPPLRVPVDRDLDRTVEWKRDLGTSEPRPMRRTRYAEKGERLEPGECAVWEDEAGKFGVWSPVSLEEADALLDAVDDSSPTVPVNVPVIPGREVKA